MLSDNMIPVYAKSRPPETLEEHNLKLLDNYKILKKYLSREKVRKYDDVIKKILFYHDAGKINHKFQNKLHLSPKVVIPELTEIEEIPHEWLSISFISKEDKSLFRSFSCDGILFDLLVKYCIAFHHSRAKFFNKEALRKTILFDLEKNKYKLGINYPLNFDYDINKDIKQRIESQTNFRNYFELLVFLKGILHKCDYTASAGIEPENCYIGNYEEDFNRWLSCKNWKLKPFQKDAQTLKEKNVVLIAETGSGKTEYSMNWIAGDKAFYLLGIRTAVNEMYKRFKKIFGNNVTLLHGEIAYNFEADEPDDNYFDRIEKARKLCSPITVATADQIVTAVFKYNGFELPYLTLSYSKVVVDEIQSFSPDSIAAIVVFLKEINKLGAKFLLMTATLPPFIKDELKGLDNIEFPEPELSSKKRHRIAVYDKGIEDERVLKMIEQKYRDGEKILVVCNTVKKAQKMYDLLQTLSPSLIHSRFILKDRKQKENKEKGIMAINDANHPAIIWIATQVVEASLDLDFDLLFTECSPIDSLFQRFGRCWRKREVEYSEDNPNINIFKAETTGVYDRELLDRTYTLLYEKFNNMILDEKTKQSIINEIFKDIEATKYFEKYKRNKDLLELGFKAGSRGEAENLFRNIAFNYCVIPRPVYDKNEKEIMDLVKTIDDESTEKMVRITSKSKLKEFTAPAQIFNASKWLSTIPNSNYCQKNRIMILNDVEYSFEKGIEFTNTEGKGVII